VNEAAEQVPEPQVVCEDEVAENEPPEMNPSLSPPLFENETVNGQDALIVNEVVVPVLPVVGDGLQPLTVYVPDGAPDSEIVTSIG
jgi:hypothetical protein